MSAPTEISSQSLSASRQWVLVFVATFCGVVAAYNIGKVPAALPVIRQEFDVSLLWSGALASSYSVTAMLFSLAFGILVSRLGAWRVVATGLCLLVAGGVLGASTNSYPVLLTSRLVEGCGFVAIAVSMPAFIGRICDHHIRPLAMGVWGTFVPLGIAISLLVSPYLLPGGWRVLWWTGSAVAVAVVALAFYTLRPAHRISTGNTNQAVITASPSLASVICRGPLLLAGCFAVYSAMFVGLATFLPTYWIESFGLTPGLATRLTALVVVMNIFGNLTGGWLCSRGVALRTLLGIALLGGGLFASLVYLDGLPVVWQLIAACCCSYISGIVPATLFANVTKYAQTASHSGLILGLLFQGAGVGQVSGPILFGAIVDFVGRWSAAPLFFISAMIAAGVFLWYLPVVQSVQPDQSAQ